MARNTSRYELWDGRKKVYVGITKDLERRAQEHENSGLRFDRLKKVGPDVSNASAREWERQALDAFQRNHGGKLPRGNKQG